MIIVEAEETIKTNLALREKNQRKKYRYFLILRSMRQRAASFIKLERQDKR
jgi:hypothetical protein